jgi:hypothetical protein
MGEREIEALALAASADSWEIGSGPGEVRVRWADGRVATMRVMRDLAPAAAADVSFVAHAREDVARLLSGSAAARSDVAARAAAASPAPWRAFCESDGGLGGCSVISVGELDPEPDLYLWLDGEIAPDADFEFVAAAREGIPRLLALAPAPPEEPA